MERSYQKLFKSLLHLLEKITRYRRHVTFINTYVQMNYIPRGFTLKFHHNTLNSNYSKILKKCSRLLMTSILGYYKKLLFRCYENYNSQLVRINWRNKYVNLIDRLHNKYKSICFILSKLRLNKFRSDGLDIRKAIMLSRKMESNFQKRTETDTNSNITENVYSG